MKGEKDWEDEIDWKIKSCVQRQLVSDVPLGAFLSGGVDSSLVVSSMNNAKTFSIGFDDPSYNELRWSGKVANHLKVDHEFEVIQPDILNLFDHLMYFMDDPIGDFSIFPTYLVSRHARKYVKVALSGDGGDELFGGYETYLADEKTKQYNYIPAFVRRRCIEPMIKTLRPTPAKKGFINKILRFAEGLEHPEDLYHARWRIFVGESTRQKLFTEDALKKMVTPAAWHILRLFKEVDEFQHVNKCLYVDLKSYLIDNCLVKTDRMSMAASLEVRVPLLDKELVETAFRIPQTLKVNGGKTKILLKRIAARHVPSDCIYRPKEGFSIPIKNWLNFELRQLMEDLLDKKNIEKDGIFNASAVETLKRQHATGVSNNSHILWSLIMFHSWQKKWLEG